MMNLNRLEILFETFSKYLNVRKFKNFATERFKIKYKKKSI